MLTGVTHKLLLSFNTSDTWSLAELCRQTGYTPDLGTYYVKQLVKEGYLERVSRGIYKITLKGAISLNRTKVNQLHVLRPRIISVLVAQQDERYIIVRRKIQPFIGKAEWPAGAYELGESREVAARRMCERHTGYSGNPQFSGFFRQIETLNDEIIDDKILVIHTIQIPASHKLKTESDTGTIELYSKDELQRVVRSSQSLLDVYVFTAAHPSGTECVEYRYDISKDTTN